MKTLKIVHIKKKKKKERKKVWKSKAEFSHVC